MKSGDIIKKLRAAGWAIVRTESSHVTLAHPANPLILTVKHPAKDVTIGLVKDLERKSGLKLR